MTRLGLLGATIVMFVTIGGVLGMDGPAFAPLMLAIAEEQPFGKRDHSAETRAEMETLLQSLPGTSAATLQAEQLAKEEAEAARRAAESVRDRDAAAARQFKMWGEFTKIGLVLGVVLAVWVIPAALIAKAAVRRGRNGAAFFLLSLTLSPVLMGLIVACMKVEQRRALRSAH